jgi:hypothetical protein
MWIPLDIILTLNIACYQLYHIHEENTHDNHCHDDEGSHDSIVSPLLGPTENFEDAKDDWNKNNISAFQIPSANASP